MLFCSPFRLHRMQGTEVAGMKRDKRAWAGVLAAATLWLASVCAGSDDLTAAVNAVRQSGLVRRLVQWELGSLFRPTDTMGLPALLALEQSPQLARARYDVEAARREEPERRRRCWIRRMPPPLSRRPRRKTERHPTVTWPGRWP